ncbi:hypothetical protein MTBBW1_460006 [Desulfamplus magnetovallimortis]|uniref:Uncharacterized protein n=1 Tax=Desulfamplus magnetovallimortis TaxID=1246637 RepID=A0A1W1HHD2_9BACT|nr:hypothetical protein MTBBW1_460006 [Desulfamplus magnetovallimortis]
MSELCEKIEDKLKSINPGVLSRHIGNSIPIKILADIPRPLFL